MIIDPFNFPAVNSLHKHNGYQENDKQPQRHNRINQNPRDKYKPQQN